VPVPLLAPAVVVRIAVALLTGGSGICPPCGDSSCCASSGDNDDGDDEGTDGCKSCDHKCA